MPHGNRLAAGEGHCPSLPISRREIYEYVLQSKSLMALLMLRV
jgi:hypothetical protein